MRILVQVTLYDDEGNVKEQIIDTYGDDGLGYEIERMFRLLGERIAKQIDPSHE